MKALFAIVLLVLDIMAILQVLKSSMTGGKKALWIILIILLPLIGLILYYLIGKKSS